MKRIILVRHGESETNLTKTFTGQLDTALTERGVQQANLAAEYLDKYKIDRVYASTLRRAYVTAKPIAKRQGCGILGRDALQEINAGVWQGLTFDEIIEKYPDTYNVWRADLKSAKPDGGESCEELYSRVVSEFKTIIEEDGDLTVCIVAHATPVRMIMSFMEYGSIDGISVIPWVPNASVTVYKYDGGVFEAEETGYCEYLGEMLTNLPKII